MIWFFTWQTAFCVVVVFAVCTALVHFFCTRAKPLPCCDDIDRINQLIGRAKHLRDQLDATAAEFVDIHDPTTDYEVDCLLECVLDGADYAESLQRIMDFKYPRTGDRYE